MRGHLLVFLAMLLSPALGGCDEDDTPVEPPPPTQPEEPVVVELSAGATHTCARVQSGEVYCWGDNSDGELGDGTTQRRERLVKVSGLTGVVQVDSGRGYSCARLADGRLMCWGRNELGMLGNRTTQPQLTPVQVVGISDASEIEVGWETTCAIRESGALRCWGGNRAGQIADGDALGIAEPSLLPGAEVARSVGVGRDHICALLLDDTVLCRGSNERGQLGTHEGIGQHGDNHRVNTFPLPGAVQLVSGASFNCARMNAGQIRCWGDHGNGALGIGPSPDRFHAEPTPVQDVRNAQEVVAGLGDAACALLPESRWVCWGSNQHGEIGRSAEYLPKPAPLRGLVAPVIVSVGLGHSCAVDEGQVKCLGDNSERQLGAPGVGGRRAPVRVHGLRGPEPRGAR